MRSNPVSSLVLAAILSACAIESELLNSERIDERFGSFGIEVLEHDAGVRRSSLFSVEGDVHVCRTYAVVKFVEHNSSEVAALHQAILAGDSIGATFKASGWQLTKQTLHIGAITVPADRREIAELMMLDESVPLAMHAYRLILDKDRQSVDYAMIIETHHPDYLTESDLRELYDDGSHTLDEEQLSTLQDLVLHRY